MKARYHATSGGIASLLLIPVLGFYSILFWLASFFIDADHYMDYVYRNGFRDFSIKKMFTYNDHLYRLGQGKNFLGLSIMHTAEFILAVYITSEIIGWLWLKAILWGLLFHSLEPTVQIVFPAVVHQVPVFKQFS